MNSSEQLSKSTRKGNVNRLSVLLPKSVPVFLAILSIWKTIRLLLSRILAKGRFFCKTRNFPYSALCE